MGIMEIVLLAAGGIIFVLSFLIPGGKETESGLSGEMAEKELSDRIAAEMEKLRGQVGEAAEEAAGYAAEKTERTLERLTNEKIMAVNEYSDTVLAEIHKNHEEAMFLYDMLNSKHSNLKDTVSEVNRTVREAEEAVSGIRLLVAEEKQPEQTEPAVSTAAEEMPAAEEAAVETEEELLEEERRNSNDSILELYRQGKTKVGIAQELGLGVGEVELVINLFQEQQSDGR